MPDQPEIATSNKTLSKQPSETIEFSKNSQRLESASKQPPAITINDLYTGSGHNSRKTLPVNDQGSHKSLILNADSQK